MSSAFESGEAGSVGSRVKVVYKDGSVWHLNVLEVSELNHFVTYELVDAEPNINGSSVHSSIRLQRVTDGDHTFLSWVTYKYKKISIKIFFFLYLLVHKNSK